MDYNLSHHAVRTVIWLTRVAESFLVEHDTTISVFAGGFGVIICMLTRFFYLPLLQFRIRIYYEPLNCMWMLISKVLFTWNGFLSILVIDLTFAELYTTTIRYYALICVWRSSSGSSSRINRQDKAKKKMT